MEWYSIDQPITDTGDHTEAIGVDWIEQLFGITEAQMAKRFPNPAKKGTREGTGGEVEEFGWDVRNLVDVNDSRNLSNGIYQGQWGDMSNYVYYGFVGVKSPTAQDTVLHLAQDDDAKVWINGEQVVESLTWTTGATVTRPFDVHLEAGMNCMMVKISEGSGGDYLNAQFEAENLEFVVEPWSTSVSPAGKMSGPWGAIKAER
jgi:hypothetical protein